MMHNRRESQIRQGNVSNYCGAALLIALCCGSAAAAPPIIIAHRGASHDAPENTLAAIRLGFEQGADFVEVDVRLTADRQIVLLHDETTNRTGGVNKKAS